MAKIRSIEGGFHEEDIRRLAKLVSIPSWIDPKNNVDDSEISEYIYEQMKIIPGATVWRTKAFEGKRRNVIVEKGKGNVPIWVIGHMDTIAPEDDWKTGTKLEIHGDYLEGLGVYDMKIGIMQMMKLARKKIPDGLKFYFMFLADEELHSRGLRQILDNYVPNVIPHPAFVYSPEIPTLANKEGFPKGKKPVVIARRGSVKMRGQVRVPPGHGSQAGIVRATSECRHMLTALLDRIESRTKLQHIHPLIGTEESYDYDTRTQRRGMYHNNPTIQDFELRHLSTLPSKVDEIISMYQRVWVEIAEERNHTARGIKSLIKKDHIGHSYDAYEMPVKNPLIQAFAKSSDDIYGVEHSSAFAGGESTSDMNLIAERGYIGLESSGDGQKEHADGEVVKNTSSYRNYRIAYDFLYNKIPETLDRLNSKKQIS